MGLLDVLNGMQNGPRGPKNPAQDKGGMSPITMAILALLAYKAVKHIGGGSQSQTAPAPAPVPSPNSVNAGLPGGGMGGGLGDLLKGGLGGLLGGAAAGSVISGGLGDLLKQFQQHGQGDVADSWVGKGENKSIAPGDLGQALGIDQINALTSQTGMSRDELLDGLSQQLPGVIDQLTPDGRLPTEDELSKWI
ncbi:MAG: YidB family protein [Bradyrhizobium sp.]|nr:YidB family protein [Bradyrhizobium sp.]